MKQNERAVSPVIGVMLMIVVTIIIAAVVSAFAGGFAESQKKTPSAQLDVQIQTEKDASGSYYAQMLFVHKGGDPIPTKDLRIVTQWTEYGISTSSDVRNSVDGSAGNITTPSYPCRLVNGECPGSGIGDFGNVTWRTGDILATVDAASTAKILGSGTPFYPGTPVSVDIVYLPTNELVLHKDVVTA